MDSEEKVICVNEFDEQVGVMDKLEAHQKGVLHRAFSVFIFNSNKQLLLQRRALTKYHSAGLWTNSCCSHPREGESIIQAANRRLKEEMGIETELNIEFSFIYKAEFNNGLIEHEYDYVLFGKTDNLPVLNLDEVDSYKYLSIADIEEQINITPDQYTEWFKICFNNVKKLNGL